VECPIDRDRVAPRLSAAGGIQRLQQHRAADANGRSTVMATWIVWNRPRDTSTSAIWNVTDRPCRTIREKGSLKMIKLSAFTKDNLNKQGFGSLDDEAKSRYALPLRFTPVVASILIVAGLALRSPIWLGAMSLVALSGALFPRWMILDLVYNLIVRHLFHAQALPATPAPRRFSYIISTVALAGSALSFHFGWAVLGFIQGGMVVIGATILATSLWCLGSWLYRLSFKHAAA
jgi:hypothetical protein